MEYRKMDRMGSAYEEPDYSDERRQGVGAMLEAKDPAGNEALLQTGSSARMNLDPDDVKNGLAQLVLTLVKFLHELLERQAIRRMDSGSLTDDEIERLGLALMKQAEEIDRIREAFGLSKEDLNLDLGPLGKLM